MVKPRSTIRGRRGSFGGAAALVLLVTTGVAAEGRSWQIERGEVKILVPLKPGGAFAATTSSVSGTLTLEGVKPARLAGDVSLDLSTIDTGIALRNQHLREKYLEVAKGDGFNKAVLSDLQLRDAGGETFDGTSDFTGTMLLHGVKRAVTGTAEIHSEGTNKRVRADFPLVLTDFGITPPEYLGVGVGSRLLVKVTLIAAPGRSPVR
jgi:polyisoprenoid-binding protein YceI